MFTVLALAEFKKRGVFESLLDTIIRRPVNSDLHTVCGGRYNVISLTQTVKGVDWKSVQPLIGDFSGVMVMPREVNLPDDAVFRRFYPRRFERQVVLSTAKQLIVTSGVQLYRRIVGVIDPEGMRQSMVLELIAHCTAVHVLTAYPKRYRRFSEQVMELYGTSVVAQSDPTILSPCMLSIAMDDFACENSVVLAGPVLSCAQIKLSGRAQVVDSLVCANPREIQDSIPDGIHPMDFMGALYELCDVRELGKLTATYGLCNQEMMLLSQLGRQIAYRHGGHSTYVENDFSEAMLATFTGAKILEIL